MSKKKVSGNTMTLKDFHGGFIPSDLPLPSAPGIIVKPSDRPSYERSSSWGNQMGRSDLRSRPHTSPATRHFEDKAPFLTHTAHIGRNFDEDERKPLDGMSAPRRTISDESIRVPPTRAELKPESAPTGGSWGRQGWAPTSQVPSGGNSYSGRVIEPSYAGVNSQNFDSNVGQGLGGAYQNAWAARKEAAVVTERQQAAWSAPVAVSKLAHASALEKVLSGRWQSKLSSPNQADVEVIISSETESALHFKGYGTNTHNMIDVMSGMENYDATLASHAERGLNIIDNVHGGRKELYDYERARAPTNLEGKERNLTSHAERGLNIVDNVHGVRKELYDYERARAPTNLEVKERNLTSHAERGLNIVDNVHGVRKELYDYERARAPTNLEVKERNLTSHAERGLNIVDNVHGGRKELYDYERPRAPTNAEVKERNLTNYRDRGQPDQVDGKLGWSDSQTSLHLDPSERPKLKLVPKTKTVESMEPPPVHHTELATESVHVESFNEVHGNMMHAKPALASTESGKQPVERPKLNLKPRSQPVEKLEGNSERGRNALFGGARPRELVLKERGIDDVAINHDLVQQSEKVEHHVPRTERGPAPVHTNALHPSEKTENLPHDQRGGKRTEKRDHLVDVERMDNQRRNWRNESRRNNRETEKHQHHHPERAPSPETWRKPIEQQPRPISADSSGPRYLKAASAVELAQSFSKSVSDPSTVQHSGQRGALPGRGQVPFSRLMGQTARPQINGY